MTFQKSGCGGASPVTLWKSSRALWTGGVSTGSSSRNSSGALDFQGRGREQVGSRPEVGAASVCM